MKRIVFTLLSLILVFVISACEEESDTTQGDTPDENEQTEETNEEQNEQSSDDSEQEGDIQEFNEEDAVELMSDYKDSFVSLINEAGEDQKADSFQTKAEVKEHFKSTMSDDLATWMTDSYFKEEDDGVYIIAKDGPTWLKEEQSFDVEKVSDGHVKIVQERDNELLGHVKMVFHAKFQGEYWVVSEIEQEEVSEQSNQGTGTNSDIKSTAKAVKELIVSQDMKTLAKHVHPERGVLFSPYVHVKEDAQVFQQSELENFFEDDQVYEWGVYDGRGNTIELTPSEYYEEFIYAPDLQDADQILVDEMKQRGNMKNNIKAFFPNSTVVEFHLEPSEESGMDWSSLNLVFEQIKGGEWKLIAIVNDQWTI
ncbi:hypothetical protein [Aquibacillus albus]|uniref:Uncharacterized protein n=1 Tax=Aquibacillus albus TaxID=1168171 RepID=A0ABS2N6R5_9BACI|nr:hypothetical protein [Aquibacillus albus]MBM7573743.1 hypothetical protein [Aquibacillus albus]